MLKQHLHESDDDVIQSVEDHLHMQDELFYQKLLQRSINCIEVHGDYAEKQSCQCCVVFTYTLGQKLLGQPLCILCLLYTSDAADE